jgi:hypothetical protein
LPSASIYLPVRMWYGKNSYFRSLFFDYAKIKRFPLFFLSICLILRLLVCRPSLSLFLFHVDDFEEAFTIQKNHLQEQNGLLTSSTYIKFFENKRSALSVQARLFCSFQIRMMTLMHGGNLTFSLTLGT